MADIQGMRLQSSLGRVEGFYRQDMNMNGFMAAAIVTKVHHKTGTADVTVVNTKDVYSSSTENEGRFAARILQRDGAYDERRERYWGSTTVLQEGSMVLIAFLDSMKHRPVILGTLPYEDNINNVYTDEYPLKERVPGFNRRESFKKLRVSPSLTYSKEDGEGNIERTFGSKSFLAIYNTAGDPEGNVYDNHNGFDHEHLSEIDKRTLQVLETDWEECKTPTKLLFVHRSSFSKEDTKWTKFFIDSTGGTRVTRDTNDDKATFVEIEDKGRFRVRRQLDTPDLDESDDHSETSIEEDGAIMSTRKTPSGIEAQIELTASGDIIVKRVENGEETTLVVGASGLTVSTQGDINFNVGGTFKVNGRTPHYE